MRSHALCSALAAALSTVPLQPLCAQDPPQLPVFSEEVSVQWVSVPTVVAASRRSALVLERDQFELRVDGAPIAIEGFDEWETPFGLLFVQDLSGSMAIGRKLEVGRIALQVLGALRGEEDELAVATFAGDRVELQAPFGSSPHDLRAASESWQGYGTTAVRDAIAALPELARATDRPRRAVVLVTDGIDNASSVPLAQVQSLLAGDGLPLYVIDVDTDTDERPSLEEGRDEGLGLAELAEASGGRRLRANTALEAQTAARILVEDLRHQIMLSFTTDTVGTPALRSIEVALLGETSGLVHRTRYFGPPPGTFLPRIDPPPQLKRKEKR
ncbi:MAG TPA: VWA domain-containing protein [Thermoanaerobaculia bacterium]|nr:VWA domain-containing protein [Thermoanaerobaculia bacterium]